MNKAMELYLEGNLLIARMETINKRFDELIKNRTPEEFAKEATEEDAIELTFLYELKLECIQDYKTWKTKKDKLLKG
jgi:hypothetical protein